MARHLRLEYEGAIYHVTEQENTACSSIAGCLFLIRKWCEHRNTTPPCMATLNSIDAIQLIFCWTNVFTLSIIFPRMLS